MNKFIKVTCDIFVFKEGKLLLGVRKNSYGAGDWGLPGGHVEWGEEAENCAIRELKEETGLIATELEFATVMDDVRSKDQDHYIHFAFIAKKFTGTPKVIETDKCEKWEFFDLENLPQNVFWPHKKLIENLKSKILYSK